MSDRERTRPEDVMLWIAAFGLAFYGALILSDWMVQAWIAWTR